MSEPESVSGTSEQPSGLNPEDFWFRWRFPLVLVAALLLSVGQPLSFGLLADQGTFDVLCSLLIFTIMLQVFEERRHRLVALPLGLMALVTLWTSHMCSEPLSRWLLISAHLMAAGVIAFALYGIVSEVISLRVTQNAVLGAIGGYLLLGIIWMLMYTALETAAPGSFRMGAKETVGPASLRSMRGTLGYFSFITLATVGYGDVTPVTPIARTLAWLEAVVGQFYLGVLVAGLVGFKVTQALDRENSGRNHG